MSSKHHSLQLPKIRVWRYLPLLIILGLAVHLLVPQITTLEKSWSVLEKMSWWGIALAILSQALSYTGAGFLLHSIIRNNQMKLSSLKGFLITLASNSIGLVAGGWVGGAAVSYGWIRQEIRDGRTAAFAGTLPSFLNNAVLVAVAILGTIHLLVVHDLSNQQLIEFAIIMLVLGIFVILLSVTLRSPERTNRFAIWFARRWATLRKKPFSPESTSESVRQFLGAWESLSGRKWLLPMLGAAANVGFDILTLFFVFLATGYKVSLGVLLAGYGLPLILGKIAFILPGGVGVIEGSMVALYDSLKVPDEISVVVILGYRLISFWLPSLLGFVVAAFLGGGVFKKKETGKRIASTD